MEEQRGKGVKETLTEEENEGNTEKGRVKGSIHT